MKKLLLLFLMFTFTVTIGYSQVQLHQLQKAGAQDQFLVSKATDLWPEYKTSSQVKTILGIPSGAVYTDDQAITDFSLTGTNLSITLEGDGTSPHSVDLSSLQIAQLTEEEVEDFVGGMLLGTQTLINVTYDDVGGNLDFVVENDLSQYDNTTSGFITSAALTGYVQTGDNISVLTNDAGYITSADLRDISAATGGDIVNGTIGLNNGGSSVSFATEAFGTGPFTLANTPVFIISVHRNGVYQELTDDYTISGSTLTLTGTTFGGSEELTVVYVHN